jgi:hypothetical protein
MRATILLIPKIVSERSDSMHTETNATYCSSIKRSALLGAKVALFVLVPLFVLIVIATVGGVVYLSLSQGVSPLEVLRRPQDAGDPESPSTFVMLIRLLLGTAGIVIYVTFISTVIGAAIGGAATLLSRR